MKKFALILIFSFETWNVLSQSNQTQYYLLLNDSIQIPASTEHIAIPDTMESSFLKTVVTVQVIEKLPSQKEQTYLPVWGDVWVVGLAGNSFVDSMGTIKSKHWDSDSSYVYSVWKQLHKGKLGTLTIAFIDKNGNRIVLNSYLYAE